MNTRVIVVGAGPAGLAASWHLTQHRIDHVVLERGRVAERWRSERWDSLRLLTPNWLSRLPGWDGADPNGFMPMPAVVDHLQSFAASFQAPVVEGAEVHWAGPSGRGFEVRTLMATYRSDALLVATGAIPAIPPWHDRLSRGVTQLHSSCYRNPAQLPDGGVAVIGASASGLQLAHELRHAGRDVVLSVGSHIRLPRNYRDLDIHRWLDLSGLLDMTTDQIADVEAARRSPSLGLVGSPEGRSLDLNVLSGAGVQLVGRAVGATDTTIRFAEDLEASSRQADRRLYRLLALFDQVAAAAALGDMIDLPERPAPTRVPPPVDALDLQAGRIGTMLWATGFRHVHPWLDTVLTTEVGELRHAAGIGAHPGTFALGLPFMRRRRSPFLDGIRDDAAVVVAAIQAHLDRTDHQRDTTCTSLPSQPGRRNPTLTGARA